MANAKNLYPGKYRSRVVELARAVRTPAGVEECNVTVTTIRLWIRQADPDDGRRKDDLTTEEMLQLARFRKENARLREEQEITQRCWRGSRMRS